MPDPYLPNSPSRIREEMLRRLGLKSLEELFSDVPSGLLIDGLNLPEGMSDIQVERIVTERLDENKAHPEYLFFLGGGVWNHYVPALVDEIVSRAEFYTSPAPYHPEMSQGILQALFEYQSMICELTGMDVANCSMYDWASAAGEAVRMAVRVKKRGKVLVAGNISPERMEVIENYSLDAGISVERLGYDEESGRVSIEGVDGDTAAVYVENPNFFGVLEELDAISEEVKRSDALLIVGVDPTSLGVVRPPGDYGADIVVGEAQPLGLHMNFGGPLLGIFAVRGARELVEQMPGRLVGMRVEDGKFHLALREREERIGRERATSNICTSEALCAVASAVYLALLGPDGMRELGMRIAKNSHYACKLLADVGVECPYFGGDFFKEFTFRVPDAERLISRCLEEYKVVPGLNLGDFFEELEGVLLTSVTEVYSVEDLHRLRDAVKGVLGYA